MRRRCWIEPTPQKQIDVLLEWISRNALLVSRGNTSNPKFNLGLINSLSTEVAEITHLCKGNLNFWPCNSADCSCENCKPTAPKIKRRSLFDKPKGIRQ